MQLVRCQQPTGRAHLNNRAHLDVDVRVVDLVRRRVHFGDPDRLHVFELLAQLFPLGREGLAVAIGGQNRGFWWVVSGLRGGLDADERVKVAYACLRGE